LHDVLVGDNGTRLILLDDEELDEEVDEELDDDELEEHEELLELVAGTSELDEVKNVGDELNGRDKFSPLRL